MRFPFTCSLVCNIALLAWIVFAKSPTQHQVSEGEAAPHREDVITASVVVPANMPAITDAAHPADTAGIRPTGVQEWLGLLRNNNAPANVLYAVAAVVLSEKYRALEDDIRYPPGSPKWAGRNTQPTEDQRRRIEALRAERDAELKALLGDDYPKAVLANRRPLIGMESLSDAKTLQVTTILSDFQAAIQKEGRNIDLGRANLINNAKEQEIAKVLTPDEFRAYKLYNSDTAKAFQLRLRNVPLTDQEYEGLFVALEERRAKQEPGSQPDDFQAQLAEIEVVAKTIGDENAAVYAYNSERSFQPVYTVLRDSGVGAAAVVQRYKAWLEFYSEIGRLQNTTSSQQETFSRGRPAAQAAYERMTKGLTAEDVTKFSQTQTGTLLRRFLSQ